MNAHKNTHTGMYTPLWEDGHPPDVAGTRTTGRLRHCSWCGSMHPEDLAAALQAGAKASLADMKYGWPHKAYIDGVPNPYVGMLECRTSGGGYASRDNDPSKLWTQKEDGRWDYVVHTPAADTMWAKFYTEHLLDATPEQAEVIQRALNRRIKFEGPAVSWEPYRELP